MTQSKFIYKYAFLSLLIRPDHHYSAKSLTYFAVLVEFIKPSQAQKVHRKLARLTRAHNFPKQGDPFIETRNGQTKYTWLGKRWQKALDQYHVLPVQQIRQNHRQSKAHKDQIQTINQRQKSLTTKEPSPSVKS